MRSKLKSALPGGLRNQLDRYRNTLKFGSGYLQDKGWFGGAASGQAVDEFGAPIPWITYPAQEMLRRAVQPAQKVFEYGSGHSSIWWSTKVREIVAVEHDVKWAEIIGRKAPVNLTLKVITRGAEVPLQWSHAIDDFFARFPDLPTLGVEHLDVTHGVNCRDFRAYALAPVEFGKGYFDIIVIDGMARSLCAFVAAEFINENGIIVFDNSERSQYNPGFAELGRRGWKRVDFYGPGPINNFEWCTSIFMGNLEWLGSDLTIPPTQRSALG